MGHWSVGRTGRACCRATGPSRVSFGLTSTMGCWLATTASRSWWGAPTAWEASCWWPSEARRYDSVGIDLVAMNVNDPALLRGGTAVLPRLRGGTQAETTSSWPRSCPALWPRVASRRVARCWAAKRPRLPDLYRKRHFDLAGFRRRRRGAQAHAHAGDACSPAIYLVGLASSGLHSNGYALVRRLLLHDAKACRWTSRRTRAGRTTGGCSAPADADLRPPGAGCAAVLSRERRDDHGDGAHHRRRAAGQRAAHAAPRIATRCCALGAWPIPPDLRLIGAPRVWPKRRCIAVFNMGIGYVLAVRPKSVEAVVRRLTHSGEQRVCDRPGPPGTRPDGDGLNAAFEVPSGHRHARGRC